MLTLLLCGCVDHQIILLVYSVLPGVATLFDALRVLLQVCDYA
jgi:hypothetical protein